MAADDGRAAARLELAAAEHGAATIAGKGVTRVQIEPTHFNVKDYLWSGTLGLAGAVGQALVVGFITYFLLVSGDSFRRKMAHIAGPRFSQKKLTVQALDEITVQIRRYLVVQLQTSLLVGLATGAADGRRLAGHPCRFGQPRHTLADGPRQPDEPARVFVGVLAWGWLWGVWGLLLGAPLLMAVKAVCDRVDDLKPIGELLGA